MRVADIPEVSGSNWLGHVASLRDDRFGFFARLNRECGDIGRARNLSTPLIFVNSPELLHELLVEKARCFTKSPGQRGPLRPFAGQGLFTSEGDLWRRQRKLMAPLFTHAMTAGYAPIVATCAREAADGLRDGQVIDAAHLTTLIALRVACKALFDIDTLDETDELGGALDAELRWANEVAVSGRYAAQLQIYRALLTMADRIPARFQERGRDLLDRLIDPIRWPGAATRELETALTIIGRRVDRLIAERRASAAPRRDLLSLLLAAQDQHGGMSDAQVRDEISTLFVAGHETTATALAWSLYLLARHPDACAKARAEGLALGGRPATFEDLPKLSYCLQVFKEALRLYPPVAFFGRQAITDVRIGNYDLPRGSVVVVSLWAMQRRPELWPDPERFDPERFTPAAEEGRHKLAFAAFGAGPRTCIGNHFALMEGPIVLATLLARADLELARPFEIEPEASATLRPKGGVPLRVTRIRPESGVAADAGL